MRPFLSVPNLHPGRSVFDLSYDKKFTCDMGQLIPVMCDHVVPGDKMILGTSAFLRLQPLVGPVMHEIMIKTRCFFVPYRILWDGWEEFISGGVDGQSELEVPEWIPTPTTGNALGSLWDFLGFPVGVSPTGCYPHDFLARRITKYITSIFATKHCRPRLLSIMSRYSMLIGIRIILRVRSPGRREVLVLHCLLQVYLMLYGRMPLLLFPPVLLLMCVLVMLLMLIRWLYLVQVI